MITDVNKAHCIFLLLINPVFDKNNILLQSHTPHIHTLCSLLIELFKLILSKFVKISVIKKFGIFLTIDYHMHHNHLEDGFIHIALFKN